jgi:hypothetical protein
VKLPHAPFVCLALAVSVGFAGCAESTTDTQEPEKETTTAAKQPKKEKPKKEKPKQDAVRGFAPVRECLEGLGYQLEVEGTKAGNSIQVKSGGGDKVADINIHRNAREAVAFERRLVVEGDQGGRFTVTYFAPKADDSAKSVIADCLKEAE